MDPSGTGTGWHLWFCAVASHTGRDAAAIAWDDYFPALQARVRRARALTPRLRHPSAALGLGRRGFTTARG
ncbi:hypothetical protein [Microbacterium ulmi]|uniref:Uncharacterized protein n=1 Tax=Microbacterium ulmi TaxID=179095 RepID=A0A7Y2Q2K8_9MICO|nr:hypothetical protein [Microbacterium ulmi]NII69126.1 hypothetical protein [Microbacterium ulmi]NNH05155.1 hypothetical protein [Microbacterium ulmi]